MVSHIKVLKIRSYNALVYERIFVFVFSYMISRWYGDHRADVRRRLRLDSPARS